jgi:hypothetical protein
MVGQIGELMVRLIKQAGWIYRDIPTDRRTDGKTDGDGQTY